MQEINFRLETLAPVGTPFGEFEIGEVLVSTSNHVGIKIGERTIRYSYISTGEGYLAHDVGKTHIFHRPRSVEINVKL